MCIFVMFRSAIFEKNDILIGQHSERWIHILINAMLLACNRKNDYLLVFGFYYIGYRYPMDLNF